MNPASWIAIMVADADKHLLDQLRQAGAVEPATATDLKLRSNTMDAVHLKSLLQASAIVETSSGRYYLNEAALAQRSRTHSTAAAWVIVFAVVILSAVAAALLLR
jgi:hypothetical protein